MSRSVMIYTALAAIAIVAITFVVRQDQTGPQTINGSQYEALKDLRSGDMEKLNFHAVAKDVTTETFSLIEGGTGQLSDYKGKYILLNFWATWCAPCRKEMPQLSALQTDMGGDDFEVVTLATGRNPPPAMKSFFKEIGVENLPLHRDPKQQIARKMAVLGLPISLILNPEGQEIARLSGDADWSSDSAKAIIRALISMPRD